MLMVILSVPFKYSQGQGCVSPKLTLKINSRHNLQLPNVSDASNLLHPELLITLHHITTARNRTPSISVRSGE